MRTYIVLLSLACADSGLLLAAEKPAAAPPNIVFFLADDLGQRDLGCYGSTFHETPNLDRLAKEGARFTDAYAAFPVCSPTRASIMTGRYPQRKTIKNDKAAMWESGNSIAARTGSGTAGGGF